MKSRDFMLANPLSCTIFDTGLDFDAYLSYKYDGIRMATDGTRCFTRHGEINPPEAWRKEWLSRLPAGVWVDGELYDDSSFAETCSAVRTKGSDWRHIEYKPFATVGETVEQFMARDIHGSVMHSLVPAGNPGVFWEDMFKKALVYGCEGLMIRRAGETYSPGRTGQLLKLKESLDGEATVIGYTPGTGKHEGRIGALVCTWRDGVTFKVGTGLTDELRENPPAIGAIVTIGYQSYTSNWRPRFPRFIRVRRDA